ncbi:hypothetical protein RclHR1_09450004 [Rhizophagus clarus]|uniref:Uncharacterized protein n=1 Tax=Rhizophagus clarus TaxID=94130 RepID=A0A2Z6SHP5_9GLOM|nr:hypothetical protein RclHR1_09450004 [Rhizophagus clarus]
MSVNESNAFEFEVLKQRITELEAENSRVLAEKAELLKQIAEERAKYEAENAELKGRIEELEKSRADADAKNARHDVVNAKLKDRVAKLEQDYGQVQSDSMPLVSSFTRSEPVVIPDCETKDAVPKIQNTEGMGSGLGMPTVGSVQSETPFRGRPLSPELHFETDYCPELFRGRLWYFEGPEFRGRLVRKSFIGELLSGRSELNYFEGLKEADRSISKVQNSKWTKDETHLAADQICIFPEDF